MGLPSFGGSHEVLQRRWALESHVEKLERHGYKTNIDNEARRFAWSLRCEKCPQKGLFLVSRVFDKPPVYSRIDFAYCVECGWHCEI